MADKNPTLLRYLPHEPVVRSTYRDTFVTREGSVVAEPAEASADKSTLVFKVR